MREKEAVDLDEQDEVWVEFTDGERVQCRIGCAQCPRAADCIFSEVEPGARVGQLQLH